VLPEGVSGLPFLTEYGSAVAGRASSGRRGRRTGADIREDPAPEEVVEEAAVLRDVVGLDTLDRDEGARVVDAAEVGRAGEKAAWADVGRSNCLRAASIWAFLCAAKSLTDGLDIEEVDLERAAFRLAALGLFGSFSRRPFCFGSSDSMILRQVSGVSQPILSQNLLVSTIRPDLVEDPVRSSCTLSNLGVCVSKTLLDALLNSLGSSKMIEISLSR
jgi:hypothetical protein